MNTTSVRADPHAAPPALPAAPHVPEHLQVRFPPELLAADPAVAAEAFARALRGYARRLPTPELQRTFCMLADTPLYEAIDTTIVEAYGGVHPKHWTTDYHDFFTQRITGGESVIDLGCGVGMVAASIARHAGADIRVVGVDWSEPNLARARTIAAEKGLADRLTYVHGDICETRIAPPPGRARFDAIVLSNVLEHITDRPRRLRKWTDWYNPRRILIRVPAFDRNWQTSLKKELGLDFRCDPTHETEYTEQQARDEVHAAGLKVKELIARWGEYWVHAIPA
ncbi:MAG: class I SAM-dependent methyltransferase [Phycisphaerales bacterium]|nr:class I SAM-dependent methyltransferase [Phycisphaerales bacterium]